MNRLEATYIVRLTAAYESIAHETLRKSDPRQLNEKSGGVELTDGLSGWLQDRIKVSAALRLSP